MKFKKGDKIRITTGRDRGKEGVIIAVYPEDNRVAVDGLNIYKKRSRPRKQGQKGEVVEVSRPLSASNVMILCGSCKKPTRIRTSVEGDVKTRVCATCSAAL